MSGLGEKKGLWAIARFLLFTPTKEGGTLPTFSSVVEEVKGEKKPWV